jgi:hypothetical protein
MSIDEIRNTRELNQYLKKTYKVRLQDFEFGLRNIKLFFDSINLKKRKKEYRTKIAELEAAKRRILQSIFSFLRSTGLWAEITEIRPIDRSLANERTVSYIKQHFGLTPYFGIIDDNIRFYRRAVILLDGFSVETEENKKRIKLSTLIALVWFYTMRDGKVTNTQKFSDISKLLTWYSTYKPEVMSELFGAQVVLDNNAIKANYDRYIKSPLESRKVYREIAASIDAERFSPPD